MAANGMHIWNGLEGVLLAIDECEFIYDRILLRAVIPTRVINTHKKLNFMIIFPTILILGQEKNPQQGPSAQEAKVISPLCLLGPKCNQFSFTSGGFHY